VCENIIMSNDKKQRFLPDDYIFKQGEKGDKAYLLLDGRVAIEVNGKKVAEISEMEIFGEMSLILNKPRTASIKALKPSIVLPINQKILNDLLGGCPPVVSSLVKQLAYRLSQCDQEIQNLKKKNN
tara:strand:- start:51 stop:428 length:378 start_codon:yes stop_codon:yes gene_type:complete